MGLLDPPIRPTVNLIRGAINVAQEGIDATGATDVTVALTSLMTANAGNRRISLPKGSRYRLGASTLIVPAGTIIEGNGAVFQIEAISPSINCIQAAGTEGAKTSLTASTAVGAQTVALPTGAGASYALGDVIGFQSLAVIYLGTALENVVPREYRMVSEVSGDTVTLDRPLEWAYLTSDTAKFFKVTALAGIRISDIAFEPGSGVTPGTDSGRALQLEKCVGARLEGIELRNMIGGVTIKDCYDTRIHGLDVNRLPKFADFGGYGLTLTGATTKTVVEGLRGRECRHLVTTSYGTDGTNNTEGPIDALIKGAIGYGAVDGYSVFDTHEYGRHIHFSDCHAIGGGAAVSGFQIRSQWTRLTNCTSERVGLRGVAVTATAVDCSITDGEFSYSGNAGINVLGTRTRIKGVDVHHSGANGTPTAGIAFSGSTDTLIEGGTIWENNNRGLEDAATAVRPVIRNAYVPKGTAQTSSLINLSATGVIDGCVFTGFGASQHGMVSPTAGCKITNLITDTGVVMNQGLYMGAPAVPSPLYDTPLSRNAFQQLRSDTTMRISRLSLGDPAASPTINTGNASPEGVVTAAPGSMYLRSSGGAGTSIYVKESGTGNTGWAAK